MVGKILVCFVPLFLGAFGAEFVYPEAQLSELEYAPPNMEMQNMMAEELMGRQKRNVEQAGAAEDTPFSGVGGPAGAAPGNRFGLGMVTGYGGYRPSYHMGGYSGYNGVRRSFGDSILNVIRKVVRKLLVWNLRIIKFFTPDRFFYNVVPRELVSLLYTPSY